jgi:hypothetical protein
MRQPHLIALAVFVRDLIVHDEQLIKFDRQDIPEADFNSSYIVVNGSGISNKQSTGVKFNPATEQVTYNDAFSQSITLEFYGDNAYINSNIFSILSTSQKALELKAVLGLSISNIQNTIDVKQILGSAFGNRVHLTFNINYTPSLDVATLRIDTAQFEFIEDR